MESNIKEDIKKSIVPILAFVLCIFVILFGIDIYIGGVHIYINSLIELLSN